MKSLLVLNRISVENANAISGLTYGFPAVSNFLGFTHALSRKLEQQCGLKIGGCAVICHQHQVQAYQPAGWGDRVFALSRNPLTKEGKTAPFNEEGRMHMQVSLLLECEFSGEQVDFGGESTEQDIQRLEAFILEHALRQRLAGGTLSNIQTVRWQALSDSAEQRNRDIRRLMLQLLPGFALVGRHDLLLEHHNNRSQNQPEAELLDSWLDFVALKFSAQQPKNEDEKAVWRQQPKPAGGWLVPLAVGFQAISPLYQPGEVTNSRDGLTPFRFVESMYSIGQWLSPHRVDDLQQLFWRYHYSDGCYLCRNAYQPDDQPLIFESEY